MTGPFDPVGTVDIVDGDLAEKVQDLLERNAVVLVAGWESRAAVVNGGTDWYTVRCYDDKVTCDCLAGSAEHCSHRIAAMIVWAETGGSS